MLLEKFPKKSSIFIKCSLYFVKNVPYSLAFVQIYIKSQRYYHTFPFMQLNLSRKYDIMIARGDTMSKFCDLHAHSVFSDGTLTPAELVDAAINAGLSAIALTDHNAVDGLPDFISAARGKKIDIVPGAEFSAEYNGRELHILGLFISPKHFDTVSDLMEAMNQRKEESNIALVESLGRAGYHLDYDAIKGTTPSGKINRTHIATAMMQKGYIGSIKEGLETLLSKTSGHYKEPQKPSAREILDFIRSIGAVSVLAHPFLHLDEQSLIEFISATAGLCGMECYYSAYDEETIAKSICIAERFGLLKSGGSDFHGTTRPEVQIGVGKGNLKIPYEWYLELKSRHRGD